MWVANSGNHAAMPFDKVRDCAVARASPKPCPASGNCNLLHPMGFRGYWWKLSQTKQSGRPRTGSEIRKLIHTMATANPTWGAPHVHGELKKLGFKISERTVSRLMPKKTGKPSQTWMAFFEITSAKWSRSISLQLRVLYVFVILAHDRRRICISMSRNTRPLPERHSRLWKRLPTTAYLTT
jgi:hypothetical protein